MFRVEFAPDAVYQLEHLMLNRLENGGRADAYDLIDRLGACVAVLREKPVSGGIHINGIPKRYRARDILPGIFLIYQVDEELACVKVDGMIDNRTEISN